jgi:hypothetical protein
MAKKKVGKKNVYEILFIFGILILFSLNFVSAYDWNFSTPSDYIYNSNEIIVTGGYAQLNNTTTAPYSWWHLNEGTGTNVADSSGNNRNGTAINFPSWVLGKLNSALQFDGTSQYIDYGNIANFERTKPFSVEFWIRLNTTTPTQTILDKRYSSSPNQGWDIYISSTNMYFRMKDTSGNFLQLRANGVINDALWHHFIITYNGSSNASGVIFYKDGVIVTSTTITNNEVSTSILNSGSLRIGTSASLSQFLNGSIDEAVIYNEVLSAGNVIYRYNNGTGTESSLPSYATGHYTIQPKTNFSFNVKLINFTETATKTGSEIKYSVTTNGTWKYWNGSTWAISNGNWTQSNNVSDINSHINTLGNSGNFTFMAVLHSTDGTYTPYLDNIQVLECSENWIANYTACGYYNGTWDKRIKTYYDANDCGSTINLPADNGTLEDCDYCTPNWYCNAYDYTCQNPPPSNWLTCVNITDSKSPTCCSLTNLTSDCNITNPDILNQPCGIIRQVLNVPSYPYVDVNTSYPIEYTIYLDNLTFYIGLISINITELDSNISTFNFTWSNSTNSYHLTLLFTEIGNFPFTIYSQYPYLYNFTGQFIVRQSFNVTFCGFEQKDLTPYENDFAYLIAEFTSSKNYYDINLEQFITPLGFATTFQTPVFHTLYRDGCGTFKLYEVNEEYAVRLFDGVATFETTFSPPNITKTYGTNIYFGKYTFNGTDSIRVLLSEKDINQYFWLFNWTYIILIGLAFVISIFLFFVIPEKPTLSIIFGVGFISMLTLLRIVLWLYFG